MQLDTLLKIKRPILITGHTGFKGTWLTLLLETLGLNVIGYSLPPQENSLYTQMKRKGKIPELFGDIRNSSVLNEFVQSIKPEVIVHFAAQPLVIDAYSDPVGTFFTNVMGTVNTLNAGYQNIETKCLAVITTDKVYRNENLGRRFIESDALHGQDPYSASKVGAESAVSAWQNMSKLDNRFPILSLRSGNVIGGGDLAKNRLMPDIIRHLHFNESLNLRNPTSTRPWQHVLDPLLGYLLAINKALETNNSEEYNFAYDEDSLSVEKVLKIVGDFVELSFTKAEIVVNQKHSESIFLNLDSSRAINELNWQPNWTQESAIRQTLEWWKKVSNKSHTPAEACMLEIHKRLQWQK